MSDSAVGDIVLIGAVAAIGYAVYQILKPVENAVSTVANAAGQVATNVAAGVGAAETGVAGAWVWATSSSVVPTGNVILPNGTSVPLSQLAVTYSNGAGVFTFDSVQWEILANPSGGPAYDSNGNYHAQQIGGTNVPAITYAQPAAAPAAAPTINPSTGLPFSTDPTQAGYYDTTLEPG